MKLRITGANAKIECPYCHKKISPFSPINGNRRQFCNVSCFHKWKHKHIKPKVIPEPKPKSRFEELLDRQDQEIKRIMKQKPVI